MISLQTLKRFSLFSLLAGAFYYITIATSGCAQIGMPVGGPKDTIPPVLLNAAPPNHSTNFTGNRIVLTFDEYIQLDNPLQNVLVSPLPKKSPFIDFRLKTVTIKLYDTLQPDKTYAIRFGKTIRDLNENNPFGGFDYVFSTGSYIDSLSLSGNVKLAASGKVDSTLTVSLYADLGDSAVFRHKPEYIARLDKNGDFTFKYLSPGTYNIFALKDVGGQYMYNNPTQLFAFYDSTIDLSVGFDGRIQLYAYQEEEEAPKPSTQKADTTFTFSTNVKSGVLDLLEPLTLTFNHPVASFDSGAARLTDTLNQSVQGVSFSFDSTSKKLLVGHAWEGGTDYIFTLGTNAVTDTNGAHLSKSDTVRFRTKNESDYGSLKLNFTNLDKFTNPVLQLVLENGEPQSFPLNSNVFEKKLLAPGSYTIRILEDRNKNGKWDPGNYSLRLQPEIVHLLPEPIVIRANWDNEKDVVLKEE